jgi:hypothetical protein
MLNRVSPDRKSLGVRGRCRRTTLFRGCLSTRAAGETSAVRRVASGGCERNLRAGETALQLRCRERSAASLAAAVIPPPPSAAAPLLRTGYHCTNEGRELSFLLPAISGAQGANLCHMVSPVPRIEGRKVLQRYCASLRMMEGPLPVSLLQILPCFHPALVQCCQQHQ